MTAPGIIESSATLGFDIGDGRVLLDTPRAFVAQNRGTSRDVNVTTMKWLAIVRFELVYQLRGRSTWFFFALFLLLLVGETNSDLLSRNREIRFNAPLFVAQSSVSPGLVALLVMAAVAGDAATRDVRTRMESLMHAAPVGRAAYLGGRFLGAFILSALMLAAVPLAFILAPLFHPGIEAEFVGPLRPAAYLQSYFLLVLPNAFVATALLFGFATLMRHTLGSYLGVAMVLAGMLLSMEFVAGTLGRWELAKLLDSTGYTALVVMGRTWPPVELNARLVGLGGGLLWNRLLWLTLAFAVLAFTYTRFRFDGESGRARWWQRARLRASSGQAGRRAASAGAGGSKAL